MEFHVGRLIDHVHLKVHDLEASKRFYKAAIEAIGVPFGSEGDGYFTIDEMYFSPGKPLTSGLHLAFQAKDKETVARFYEAALAAGGRDNGAPGERHYHPGYYAAFVLDLDGNNIEAVYHGPSKRSAASVVVTPAS